MTIDPLRRGRVNRDRRDQAFALQNNVGQYLECRRKCEGLARLQGVTIQRDMIGSVYTLMVDAPFGSTYVDAHCLVETGRYANWREAESDLYGALLPRLKDGLIKCEDEQCDVCVEVRS